MEIIPSDHPNILIGIRRIEHGDQTALFSSEVAALGRAVAKVRRQSGAARIIARTLLGQMGFPRPLSSRHDLVFRLGQLALSAHWLTTIQR